jgi:hypothetical protein
MSALNSGNTCRITCPELNGQALIVHGMSGWIAGLQDRPDKFARRGGAGSGAQSLGTMAKESTVTLWVACITNPIAMDTADFLEAIQGKVVKIFDQHARTLPRVRVWESTVAKPLRCAGPPVSGTSRATYRVEATLVLERLPDQQA